MGRFTVEDLVSVLAGLCDGARRRDRKGFNKSDTMEGHRLDAMNQAGIAWGDVEIAKGREFVRRYAVQLSRYYTRDQAKLLNLERLFRDSRAIDLKVSPVVTARPFRYASLSTERSNVLINVSEYDQKLSDAIKLKLRSLAHGERRVSNPFYNKKRSRWEIPYNGTTRPVILAILREHDYIWDREIDCPLDAELDALLQHARAAFLAEVSISEFARQPTMCVVFDTDGPVKAFISELKRLIQATDRTYDPDDQIWCVRYTQETAPVVARIIDRFGFAITADLQQELQNTTA
ncbi:hypothetical protein UAJ10_28915 [Nitrospirillum sp. BR 11164]|uniref:hypothetical protein n=1 Tax=Nitrospirillum sp. BR 11164 TaxID=3104324 RepID=UPI002AFE3DC3|nr:hypothetical protein [Nitrospirillum sp. BR 11164]MEA1653024.1 hypothetical protein [Nitrospirillum sp. BR 11164]